MIDAVKFIRHIQDEEAEEKLWDMWKHFKPKKKRGKEEVYITFSEFKKQQGIRNKNQIQNVTTEEESKRLEFATQFIKVRPGKES
jgi:hypothetical protein